MKTINVSFEDKEIETIEKAKRGQSWRKFILERAAIDSSNELHSKGINADALRGLCLEYDLKYGANPEKYYDGLSLLVFFFQTVAKTDILVDENETDSWIKQIAELKKIKKRK